jgi:cell division protein FtsB
MNFGDMHGTMVVLAIIAMSTIGWIITTAIRAKHGYPVTDDWGNTIAKGDLGETRKVELLSTENARLTGQIGRLEERIAVLERIATDPAERTAREIDALR